MENLNIDITKTEEVVCGECGGKLFVEARYVRRLSALLSPTGKMTYIPIPTFACKSCGHVNEEFLPTI